MTAAIVKGGKNVTKVQQGRAQLPPIEDASSEEVQNEENGVAAAVNGGHEIADVLTTFEKVNRSLAREYLRQKMEGDSCFSAAREIREQLQGVLGYTIEADAEEEGEDDDEVKVTVKTTPYTGGKRGRRGPNSGPSGKELVLAYLAKCHGKQATLGDIKEHLGKHGRGSASVLMSQLSQSGEVVRLQQGLYKLK